jgi:hypothetical protein
MAMALPAYVLVAAGLANSSMTLAQDSPRAREAAVSLARAALAGRPDVDAGALELATAVPREWRDASLGCPERGVVYPQAIVPGYLVTFRAGGVEHRVHAGAGRAVVCVGGRPATPPAKPRR